MAPKIIWLFIFVALYWAYCIFWGVKSAMAAKTASDYFIAGRRLSMWVFILAATATSFSGWTFMGHPGLVYRDGFQYAYASFYTITIPFTGVMFLKRQWMLGKRFGYVTPGEMLSDYFQGDGDSDPDRSGRAALLDPLSGRAARRLGLPVQRSDRRSGQRELRHVGPVGGRVHIRGIGRPTRGGLRGHPAVYSAGLRHHCRRHHRTAIGRWLGRAERRLRQDRRSRSSENGNRPRLGTTPISPYPA